MTGDFSLRTHWIVVAACAALIQTAHSAVTVILNPSKDNTLIEDPKGALSNGVGEGLFAGRVGDMGQGRADRGMIAFDLSSIPPGSTITDVSLTMLLVATVVDDHEVSMHRVLANWGEGASNGFGGTGTLAEAGDATWLHRFYPSVLWTSPGGDFDPTISATLQVGFSGVDYTWTSAHLIADVQGWVNNPCANFGWILVGDESELFTSKKFASNNWSEPENRPRLSITYTPAVPCAADIDHNHTVNIDDLLAVITGWGPCTSGCCIADVDHNATVNIDDLLAVINGWGMCH
jgi:hypothetical protein